VSIQRTGDSGGDLATTPYVPGLSSPRSLRSDAAAAASSASVATPPTSARPCGVISQSTAAAVSGFELLCSLVRRPSCSVFLHCFVVVSWVTGMASAPYKKYRTSRLFFWGGGPGLTWSDLQKIIWLNRNQSSSISSNRNSSSIMVIVRTLL